MSEKLAFGEVRVVSFNETRQLCRALGLYPDDIRVYLRGTVRGGAEAYLGYDNGGRMMPIEWLNQMPGGYLVLNWVRGVRTLCQEATRIIRVAQVSVKEAGYWKSVWTAILPMAVQAAEGRLSCPPAAGNLSRMEQAIGQLQCVRGSNDPLPRFAGGTWTEQVRRVVYTTYLSGEYNKFPVHSGNQLVFVLRQLAPAIAAELRRVEITRYPTPDGGWDWNGEGNPPPNPTAEEDEAARDRPDARTVEVRELAEGKKEVIFRRARPAAESVE